MSGLHSPPKDSASGAALGGRLDSWKEIAAYLNRGVRTVVRWERDEGLPVHRLLHDKRGSVYAYKTELDAWQRSRAPAALDANLGLPPAAGRRWRFWRLVSSSVLGLAGFVVAGLLLLRSNPERALRVTPFTNYAGIEKAPAISPDGKFVAFVWTGPADDNADIYLKMIGSGAPLRLTTDPGIDYSPSWSPDGRWIAFVRRLPDSRHDVLVVSPLGAGERKLATLSEWRCIDPLRISWSPDGRWIVAPHAADEAHRGLCLISVQTGESRQLTNPPPPHSDASGVIAPDGRQLAFLRSTSHGSWQLNTQALSEGYRAEGEPKPCGPVRYSVLLPVWRSGSRELFYVTEREGTLLMWRALASGFGSPQLVSGNWPVRWTEATLSAADDKAVLADAWTDDDIWRVDLPGRVQPGRFLSSTARDINPAFSPDGSYVAFSSMRSGSFQIWVANSDGTNERQVTSLDSTLSGMPRWSPDGNRIAFDARVGGKGDVWVVDAGGGAPQKLTSGTGSNMNPSWSRDGRWIYFCSERTGRAEIWKMPSEPRGPEAAAVQVTRDGGWNGFESADGRFLYYANSHYNPSILRMPVDGGDAVVVIPRVDLLHNFTVVQGGIYYGVSWAPDYILSVWFYSFASGQSKKVADTGKRTSVGISVSPDRRWLLCTVRESRGGDLWLIERSR